MRTDVDVVVAGLGVLGAAAAAELASNGLAVIGLDRHRPPHGLGSSHGGSRIIRRVYSEGSLYLPLVARAYQGWRELERRAGTRLLLERGGLFLGPSGSEMVEAALACARQGGLEHELLGATELRRRFPSFDPSPETNAVFDPAAGVLLAERCVEALLAEAGEAGAELRFDCAVTGWETTADVVEIGSDRGALTARHLVLATGPWLAAASPLPGAGLAVERQVQHWFEPRAGNAAASELPPFVWELTAQRTWYGLPDLGDGLKVGIHRGGEATTADRVRREIARAETQEAQRLLERYLPEVTGRWRKSEACMYTNTADLRFLAGPLPNEPRVWALGGGSGHAFKFAPALAELVARGLAERRPPLGLAPFLPERFATVS